jgi:hypothetical protein
VQAAPLDAVIAELAERQHGVVSLCQLQSAGLGRAAVAKRAQAGRLHRIHRGVYAVGRPGLTQNGRRMAAVLAYRPRAVLSHRSAAGLWNLRPDNRPNVEISVPREGVRARTGIDLHRSPTLCDDDVTVHTGIPTTTVARTLVDLGDVTNRRTVEQAVEQADVLHLFDLPAIDQAIERAGSRRGPRLLSTVLTTLSPTPTLTQSDLEEAFLRISRAAGLRDPEVNAPMTLPDGGPFHRTPQSRERDTRRDQLLRLAGFDPVRFTDRQVALEPEWVSRTLLALASRADGERSGRAGAQAA